MNPKRPVELSIIIVNWNSKDFLRKCLASVYRETTGLAFEILVIDSGSFDGCDKLLQAEFPLVRFIQSESNLGFARANNLAYQSSTGETLLFLNPDTELVGPAILSLYEAAKKIPSVGVIGAKLLNSDGSIQTSCIKAFPTLINQFLEVDFLLRKFPCSRLWGMKPLFQVEQSPSEVEVISGACLFVRRMVFEKAGRFTEKYFMYSEDVDLCFKSRQAGFKNYFVPAAIVVHHGGQSSSKAAVSSFSSVMFLESRSRYFANTRSFAYGAIYRAGICLVSLVRLAISWMLRAKSHLPEEESRWRATMTKWIACFRWALGLEKWVKRY